MTSKIELKNEDLVRLKELMNTLNLKDEVSVIKYALNLVERDIKEKKWKMAAKKASKSSMRVNAEFANARD